jgi:hypothetical protein
MAVRFRKIPTWNRYSTGHWEGDTLVVETSGFRDDLWLDAMGNPLTGQAKMTERIRGNYRNLEVEITINELRLTPRRGR